MYKILLSASLAFFALFAYSQSETGDIDKRLRFGFNLGANYSFLQPKEALPDNSEMYNGIGIKLGVYADYPILKNLSFTPKTEIAFNKSGVKTSYINNSISTYKVFPTTLEIMAHFRYTIGDGKTIPYILAGPNYRLPLKNNPKVSTEFRNRPDLALDLGVGIENKLSYFTFSPELRYSYGLFNVNDNPIFQTLYYHNISIVLNYN